MRIILDGYGGDHAPLELVKGAVSAAGSLGVEIVLVGNEEELRTLLSQQGYTGDRITVRHAAQVLTMEDEPTSVVKAKKDSSMAVSLSLLRDGGGDAVVSAGNTGALLTGATLIVKRVPGVKRAALCPLMPGKGGPVMLIDAGANVECKPEYLLQFAVMGSRYMQEVMGIKSPRVGLVSNGTESHKGAPLQKETYPLLLASGLNFVGNIEGRDLPMGGCDVAVTDGFTGNVILKVAEGMGSFFGASLKDIFTRDLKSKLAALMLMKGVREFKKSMDYKSIGGAPLLGISRPVIKAHGSSDARAVENAVRQAVQFSNSGMTEKLAGDFAPDGQE